MSDQPHPNDSNSRPDAFFNRTRLRPIVSIALVIGGVLALFQNCGTYEPIANPLYDSTLASTCVGTSCTQDINYLAIRVTNSDPILIVRNTETAIDLSGYCDTAGYPDSRIYAEMKSGATSVVASYLTTSKCDANGRFRVLFPLPNGYNYTLAYSIVLTFRAVDSAGKEYDHPTGVNRREIAVLTAP